MRLNRGVMTDADGRYEVTDLPAAKLNVTATKVDYVRAGWGQKRPLGPAEPIDLAAGEVRQNIDFVLQHAGAIAGKIVDEFGDPLTDVLVMPMRFAFVNGERRLQPSAGGTSTDDLGEYRMFGLAPGQYIVSATLRTFDPGADAQEHTAYVATYYPGTGNPAEAQKISVGPGQTIAGANLTLLPITATRVSGTAFDIQGQPLTSGFVSLMPRNGIMLGQAPGGPIRPDGTFVINGATPGDYTIRANSPALKDEYAIAQITIGSGELTGVQLIATKPTFVRGRVVFDTGGAKPPTPAAVRVSVIARPVTNTGGNAPANDDGTFEVKTGGAPHMFVRAVVNGSNEWRLKRVIVGGVDVTDSGLEVPPNATFEDVVVEMTSRMPEVAFTVTDANGARVSDCVVVLFARDDRLWAPPSRYVNAGRPNIVESTLHARVTPGDYYAAAFEETEPNLNIFFDPEILAQLREHATPFSIADGEKTAVEVKLVGPPVY